MGSGSLASTIPPSGMIVFIAAIAEISIGKMLIAGIIPGLINAALYASYVVIRCWLQPSIAPSYKVILPPISVRLKDTAHYVLPLGLIIFSVIGVIFIGWATPTEAAALGAISTLILTAAYGKMTWRLMRISIRGTLRIVVMMFMIVVSAQTFSQILAFTGATRGLAEWAVSLPVPPLVLVGGMLLVVLVMGTSMTGGPIILLTMPIFMPLIRTFGFSEIWFGVMILLGIEMGFTTPPFGMLCFVMKGVCGKDTTMGDIYRAALPFLGCDLILLILLVFVTPISTWLPGLMWPA